MHRMALSRPAFALALLASTLVGIWACSDTPKSISNPGGSFVAVSVSPSKVKAGIVSADGKTTLVEGGSVDVSVIATNTSGAPGTGTVTIKVSAGSVDGMPDSITKTLANGSASVHWTCTQTEGDDLCSARKQRVEVTWRDAANQEYATFLGPFVLGDGGTDVADAGPEDDAGQIDAGPPADASLSLVADPAKLFARVGAWSQLTATLRDHDGGTPMADKVIVFSSSKGGLAYDLDTDGGTPAYAADASMFVTTDTTGVARARIYEAGITGGASTIVQALHEATNARASVKIEVLTVRQISWTATTCGGKPCTMMGIKGSGFNEQAQVTFQVVDTSGNPVPDIEVTFSIPNAPPDTRVSPSGTTDGSGNVTANLSAGKTIGAFTVHAVVIPGEVEVSSNTIPIRGAKPANDGFSLICSPRSIAAFVAPPPDGLANIDVPCLVKLVDRYGNPVGTGTTVGFKAEAGTIPNDITAKKYDFGTLNTDEGTATVTFNTVGRKPVDVEPFPADASQLPHARAAEPSHSYDAVTYNPRDGLVTIIAYVRGEEFFWDSNSNGVYDEGEQFYDQGEPFVDSNDNGVWDPGETFIDEGHGGLPPNGRYDGPNGVWDDDTTIWVETRILYTGAPYEDLTPRDPTAAASFRNPPHSGIYPNPFAAACPGGLDRASSVPIIATREDVRYNRMAAATTFAMALVGARGTLTWTSYSPVVDDFGIAFEHVLIDATTKEMCRTASSVAGSSVAPSVICEWKTIFYGWEDGTYAGVGGVEGVSLTDTNPCKDVALRLSTTISSVNFLSLDSPGGVK